MRYSAAFLLAIFATAILDTSCDDCTVAVSCVPDYVAVLTLSASPDSGLVDNAVVHVSGASTATEPCFVKANKTMCIVFGGAGTYTMEVSAPGFQSIQRTVTVKKTPTGPCTCDTVGTQFLNISMVRG